QLAMEMPGDPHPSRSDIMIEIALVLGKQGDVDGSREMWLAAQQAGLSLGNSPRLGLVRDGPLAPAPPGGPTSPP
ncbi:MAG TPA: hypothetical protein VHG93_22690, partial [Longimicrobium sp.]|nr:hypothetical protein [Longimicrobium sp.]